MSHRKSKSSPSVTLFPFLAVLVCTMGALILLLLVTTRRVRQQAIAREVAAQMRMVETQPAPPATVLSAPDPEPAETTGPLLVAPAETPPPRRMGPTPEEIEARRHAIQLRRSEQEAEWQRLVAELESQRAKRKRAADEGRQMLAAVEADLQRSQTALSTLHAQIKQRKLQQTKASATDQLFDSEQAKIQQEIGDLTQKIADLKQQQTQTSSRFAFIPYDGQSGTTRRPIFIECSSQGLRILPEDELLGASQLSGFTERYNPLLSGIRALLDFWSGRGTLKPNPPDTTRPYVLLLVRPSGTVSYYLARRLLTHLGEPFGYELIDDDYPLSLPAPDPQARAVLKSAIQETQETRAEVLNSTERKQIIDFKSFDPDSEPNEDPLDNTWARNVPRPQPYKSGGSGTGTGTGTGTGSGSAPRVIESHGLPGGEMPEPQGGAGISQGGPQLNPGSNSPGLGTPGGSALSEAPLADIGLGAQSAGDSQAGGGPGGTRRRGAGTGAGTGLSDNEFVGTEPLPPPRGNPGDASNPFRVDGPGGSAPTGQAGLVAPNRTTGQNRAGTPHAGKMPNRGDAAQRAEFTNGNDVPEGSEKSAGDARGEFQEQLANAGRRDAGSRQGKTPEDKPFRQPSTGPSLIEDLPGESLEAARGDAPADPRQQSARNPRAARTGGTAASGSTAPASSDNSGGPQGGGPPVGNVGPRRPRPAERAAMAKQRWGSARGASSIGLEKTVQIAVTRDKILIGDGEIAIAAGQGETREELVEQVLQAIDEQSRGWGPPPANFFWIPAASFHVYPGGNQHYERLHAELNTWGLFSTAKFEVGEAPPAAARETIRRPE